jgi:hypothetical protein
VVATLSTARSFRLAGTQPRSPSPSAQNRSTNRTAGRSFAPQVAHLRSGAARLWREHGLLKSRKKKYQRNQDPAHIKARWALFQQVSADTKDLDDIPYYWPQFAAACCSDPSPKNTALRPVPFSLRVFNSIWIAMGVSLHDLVWQTDNGGEFKGQFSTALGDSQHVRITPTAHIY